MKRFAPTTRFAASTIAWTLALLGVVRLPWVDERLVAWLIDVQRQIAIWYGAPPTPAVIVDARCSGADVCALIMAVCLAYPTAWSARFAGALVGAGLLLVLNIVRIGTLLMVGDNPGRLETLHLFVWPSFLILGAATYALVWIAVVERATIVDRPAPVNPTRRTAWRFGIATIALLLVHGAAAPWTMTSESVLRAAGWTAVASGSVLSAVGLPASAQGNFLYTSRGVYQMTQECLLTPMLPLYLAAAIALPLSHTRRWFAILLAPPLFLALGVARALVLAIPAAVVDSPVVIAHGFFQIAAGVFVIGLASVWQERQTSRGPSSRAAARFLLGCLLAIGLTAIFGGRWRDAMLAGALFVSPRDASAILPPGDVQGAMPFLPVSQLALLVGLTIAARRTSDVRRVIGAFLLLALTQIALFVLAAETTHRGIPVHAIAVRAWAVAVPIALWWVCVGRPDQATDAGHVSYRVFWRDVGDNFPDLADAASTALYYEHEVELLSAHLPRLDGARILKSDLWDEAKNSRILRWAADQGARVYGIDISEPIVRQARGAFDGRQVNAALADLRFLPFADGSFDAIYSMGTIEHFDGSESAVAEMARVLKPEGRLILGAPNRYDPFLRPLLVAVLSPLGLYDYGFEKSYSRRRLRWMLTGAGLDVVAETAILFVPGGLRMVDLLAHTRGWTGVERVTAALVMLFARLNRRYPRLRRHGYLLASVGVKRQHPNLGS